MKAICSKREPGGMLRCELPGGHDKGPRATPHESGGKTWGAHNPHLSSSRFGSSLPPGKPLKQRSEKKIEDDETWAFIKECFMACHPFCVDCGRAEDDTWTLDLDHVVSRGRGGRSVPTNAALLCRHRFDRNQGCHPAKTGVPMFSGSEEAV